MLSLTKLFISPVSRESSSLSLRQESIFHNSGKTEERVVYFSPLSASGKGLSGSRTSFSVSRIVMSLSFGIRCHFFLSSARTAHRACCCSTNLSTVSYEEFQRAGASRIKLCSGSPSCFCFELSRQLWWPGEGRYGSAQPWQGCRYPVDVMALLTARCKFWPKQGIHVSSSLKAFWLLDALSVVMPASFAMSNVQLPLLSNYFVKCLPQTVTCVVWVQATTAWTPGVQLPWLCYVLYSNGHERVCSSACPQISCACIEWLFFEILCDQVPCFTVDFWYFCVHEIISTWKLISGNEFMEHLLKSCFFNNVDFQKRHSTDANANSWHRRSRCLKKMGIVCVLLF